KYLLGYFAIGAATLVTLLAKIILQRTAELFGVVLPLVSVALLMMALLLPPMLRFGVEKARLFFLLFVCSMAAASAGITARFAVSEMALPASLALGLPLLALIGNAVSIALSLRLYPRRSF
ncbi:MAG: ABC-2 transporter permease, partial [Ruthenibacterium sp.]